MATITPPKNLNYYFRKGHILSDIGKIFSASYYSNKAYYKDVLTQYINFSTYINIFNSTAEFGSIHTDVEIQPNILGATTKDVVAIHGKPNLIFTEQKLTIYVYKWKFNGFKTRCEIHLYNNKAFLVNYIHNQLDTVDKGYIVKALTCKYSSQQNGLVDLFNNKIVDQNNNVVFINDYAQGFKVTYLSNIESDWYEAMAAEVNAKKERQQAKVMSAEKSFLSKI